MSPTPKVFVFVSKRSRLLLASSIPIHTLCSVFWRRQATPASLRMLPVPYWPVISAGRVRYRASNAANAPLMPPRRHHRLLRSAPALMVTQPVQTTRRNRVDLARHVCRTTMAHWQSTHNMRSMPIVQRAPVGTYYQHYYGVTCVLCVVATR